MSAESLDKAPEKIAGMFDAIAGRYDLLNTVLSGGLDRYWRRRAITSLHLTGRERLLDVCTGTADVAIGAARKESGAARVVGVDFSGSMLTHGLEKVTSVRSHESRAADSRRRHEPPRGRRIGGRRDDRVRHPQCAASRNRL